MVWRGKRPGRCFRGPVAPAQSELKLQRSKYPGASVSPWLAGSFCARRLVGKSWFLHCALRVCDQELCQVGIQVAVSEGLVHEHSPSSNFSARTSQVQASLPGWQAASLPDRLLAKAGFSSVSVSSGKPAAEEGVAFGSKKINRCVLVIQIGLDVLAASLATASGQSGPSSQCHHSVGPVGHVGPVYPRRRASRRASLTTPPDASRQLHVRSALTKRHASRRASYTTGQLLPSLQVGRDFSTVPL